MQTQDFLVEFYTAFLRLTDIVLPALRPSEALVCVHLFSHTIAARENRCSMSYGALQRLTGLTIPTLKATIAGLAERGLIRVENPRGVGKRGRGAPNSYYFDMDKIVEKSGFKRGVILRDPLDIIGDLLPPELDKNKDRFKDIIEKLTPEDRDMLELLYKALTPYEQAQYASLCMGEPTPDKIRELVFHRKFGPERKKKYGNA